MPQELLQHFYRIIDWCKNNGDKIYGRAGGDRAGIDALAGPADPVQLKKIEDLLEEPLPATIKSLWEVHDGESNWDSYSFLEQRFINAAEVISQLEFARTQKKPANRYIADAAASGKLLEEIVAAIRKQVKKKDWHKVEFRVASGSFTGPMIYTSESADGAYQEMDYATCMAKASELHALEKEIYNWDELNIRFYIDGRVDVSREDYDLAGGLITAFRAGTVKPLYFHYKWLPLFSDGSGNYIGIDLDPDGAGNKGQVIIYGRDVYENRKVTDSLEVFFERIIADLAKGDEGILLKDASTHIQERLKLL
jgi:cell wall assembly regulator SMI1